MPKDNIGTIAPATLITIACLGVHIFVPCDIVLKMQQDSILLYAVCYSLSHVGWVHLAINLYALWLFRPRPFTCVIAGITAVLASVGLSWIGVGGYVGLSGFLFAAVARYYTSWSRPIWFPVLINLAMLLVNLLPLVGGWEKDFGCFAWHVHLSCFFMSYIFWVCYYKQKRG